MLLRDLIGTKGSQKGTLVAPFAGSPSPTLQTLGNGKFNEAEFTSDCVLRAYNEAVRTSFEVYQHYKSHNADLEDFNPTTSTQSGLKRILQFAQDLFDGTYLGAVVQSTSGCSTAPALHTTKSPLSKWKRGLSGFVNGTRISALPDTGSLRNVISHAFAQEMNLRKKNSPSNFTLGNGKLIKSIGELDFHSPLPRSI